MIKHIALTLLTTLTLVSLPFLGGDGPSPFSLENSSSKTLNVEQFAAAAIPQKAQPTATEEDFKTNNPSPIIVLKNNTQNTVDTEHVAQKAVPEPTPTITSSGGQAGSNHTFTPTQNQTTNTTPAVTCSSSIGGGGTAPGVTDTLGQGMITGTTSNDIQTFSAQFNAIRAANCLPQIPVNNFRYDACMEQRLFWMAEDPSTDPSSAWGHIGSVRSDGVPSRGCDGNLAGGSGNTGTIVAQKWWDSLPHRLSLYRPSYTSSTSNVCIYFAMSHGGIPNEPSTFTRAAAIWGSC